MATRRETVEFLIRLVGDDTGLQRTLRTLEETENKIARTQLRASQGFAVSSGELDRNINKGARIDTQLSQLARQTAIGTFLGQTVRKNNFNNYTVDDLRFGREALRAELNATESKLSAAERRNFRTTINAITSRLNALERQQAETRTRVGQNIAGNRAAIGASNFGGYLDREEEALSPQAQARARILRNIDNSRQGRSGSGFNDYETITDTELRRLENEERARVRERVQGNINRSRTARIGGGFGGVKSRFNDFEDRSEAAINNTTKAEAAAERQRRQAEAAAERQRRQAEDFANRRVRSERAATYINNTAPSILRRKRNFGQTLDNVLDRDGFNALINAAGDIDFDTLDPYDRARVSNILGQLGVRGSRNGVGLNPIGGFGGNRPPRGPSSNRGFLGALRFGATGLARGLGYGAALLGPSIALAGAYAAGQGISSGISGSLSASAQIESNQLFLGGSLANFFNFGQNLNAAQNLSAARQFAGQSLIPQIRETAIASPLTYQELFSNFTTASPILFGKGIRPEDALQITNRLFSIGKAQGIKTTSIIDDVRALNTGILRNAQTFQAIGVDKEQFKDLASLRGQDLVDALNKLFEPFDETLKEYENTYEGKMARLSDQLFALQVTIGDALAPVVLDFVEDLTTTLQKAQADGTLENFAQSLAATIEGIGAAARGLGVVVGALGRVQGLIQGLDKITKAFGGAGLINPETGNFDLGYAYGALGEERGARQASKEVSELHSSTQAQAIEELAREGITRPPKKYKEVGSAIPSGVRDALSTPGLNLPGGSNVGRNTVSGSRKVQTNQAEIAEYEKKVRKRQAEILRKKGQENTDLDFKDRSGLDSSDEEKKKRTGVAPSPTVPVADTTVFTALLSNLSEQQQGNEQEIQILNRQIQRASEIGDVGLVRRLMTKRERLIVGSASIAREITELEYRRNVEEATLIQQEIQGSDDTAPLDPFSPGINITSVGGKPLSSSPTITGKIGSKVSGTDTSTAQATREQNKIIREQNQRQRQLNQLEEAERTKKLNLLKIENDLQLQLIDLKTELAKVTREENKIKALALPTSAAISAEIAALSPFASNRTRLNAQLQGLDVSILSNRVDFEQFIGQYPSIAAAASNPRFRQFIDQNRLLEAQKRNLQLGFNLGESDRRFGLTTARELAGLDLFLSSGYATPQDLIEAYDKQIRVQGAQTARLLFRPDQEENIQQGLFEIQRLKQEREKARQAIPLNQEKARFDRRLQLFNQDPFNQGAIKNQIRGQEAQSALNNTDFTTTLTQLQFSTDPQLRGLYKKYSGLGPGNIDTFRNLQNELRGIVLSSKSSEITSQAQLDAFQTRLQYGQQDYASFLNGGTGIPSTQERFERKLQGIQQAIQLQYSAEGPIADLFRTQEFKRRTQGLRGQFQRDLAVEGLRIAGDAGLQAFVGGQDPITAFAQSAQGSLNLGDTFSQLFSRDATAGQKGLATQNLGALIGSTIIANALPGTYASEGSSIGGLIGTSLGGPAGTAIGLVAGTLFGGLFGKKSGPDPEDEARKQFQDKLLDLVSGINKNLQQAPDFFRSFGRAAIFGTASRYYGGRAYSNLDFQYNRGAI